MSDDGEHELSSEDKRILKHVADKAREDMPTRRDALKYGAVGFAAAGLGSGATGTVIADGHNDNDGQVGTDSNPVDLIADYAEASSVSATTFNDTHHPTTASGISTAIQEIQSAGGGILHLPLSPSGLDVSSEVPYTIDFQPIIIKGYGVNATVLDRGSAASPVFRFDGPNVSGNLDIAEPRDFRVQGAGDGSTPLIEYDQWHGKATRISHQNSDHDGAGITDCYNASFESCSFAGNGRRQVTIADDQYANNLLSFTNRCLFNGTGDGTDGQGVHITVDSTGDTADTIQFDDCLFIKCGTEALENRGARNLIVENSRFDINNQSGSSGITDIRVRNSPDGVNPSGLSVRNVTFASGGNTTRGIKVDILEGPGPNGRARYGGVVEGCRFMDHTVSAAYINDTSGPVEGLHWKGNRYSGISGGIGAMLDGPGATESASVVRDDINGRTFNDTSRPSAGALPNGTWAFNTTDGQPNYVSGTDWVLPDGSVT